MLLLFVKFIGWACALCPEPLLSLISKILGSLVYWLYVPRRRIMLHSLACSFPDKSKDWCQRIGRTSCIRLVETSLFSVAIPFLTEERIKKIGHLSAHTEKILSSYYQNPHPALLCTMHLAYWEGLPCIPLFLGRERCPEIASIYRPFRDPRLDEWVRNTRERFGVRLISRNRGLHAAMHTLQRKGCVGLLFDQSAGSHGYLTRFLGRECSTTPLPGLLVEKSGAKVNLIFAKRSSFWRFSIEIVEVAIDGTAQGVTLAINREFERLLRTDENLCSSWLWLHQRWRILDRPEEKQKMVAKRGGLIE